MTVVVPKMKTINSTQEKEKEKMKRGTFVAVCHDGKWGRRVKGVVVATRQGHHVQVKCVIDDEEVLFWARRRPAIRHLRRARNSFMSFYKRPVSYAGWAEIDTFIPWYAVYRWEDE